MKHPFNTKSAPRYNGKKPFVLVDIDDDDPTRGDTHGHIGLARRVAHKLDADFLFLDRAILEEMYPTLRDRDARLKKLFEDKGYPDFLFSSPKISWSEGMRKHIGQHGTGLIVQSVNEALPKILKLRRPRAIVPHDLSPETLQTQGVRFAQEYEELPRPFIGIQFVNLYGEPLEHFVEKLAEACSAYDQASFFICSCHRTPDSSYDRLMTLMQERFKNTQSRFPVVGFNYKFHAENYGLTETWNPYAGLLDQADHLIVVGRSYSIVSEALATGKTVHTTSDFYEGLEKQGYLKSIFDYKAKTPLKTQNIPQPIDLTGECADKLIATQKKLRGPRRDETGNSGIFDFIRVKILRTKPSGYKNI